MTTSATTTGAAVEEVLKQEAERCRAIYEQDWAVLEPMMSDDLTYVHMPGRMEDKAAYLAGVKSRPRKVERQDLKVRVYGNTAIMTGIMINRPPNAESVTARVTQTWVKTGSGWQMVAFQASRIQPAGS